MILTTVKLKNLNGIVNLASLGTETTYLTFGCHLIHAGEPKQ